MDSFNDTMTNLYETLSEAFENMLKTFAEIWDNVKEVLNDDIKYNDKPKIRWQHYSFIQLKSQVAIRKPRMITARSSC